MQRGYKVVSGGTDNHLFLVDLVGREFTGKDAEEALGRAHITINKNTVPGEPRSPFVTSGLRLGTPAVTTRGFGVAECVELANAICDLLDNFGDAAGRAARAFGSHQPVPAFSCLPAAANTSRSMWCPLCNHADTRVVDSRLTRDGMQIRRRRECMACNNRFNTFEAPELKAPRVIKSDGAREAFSEDKLRHGMLKALEKRPVETREVERAIRQAAARNQQR